MGAGGNYLCKNYQKTALKVLCHSPTCFEIHTYFYLSCKSKPPYRYCGCTFKKCPTVNTCRDPVNHEIFLVLVSFLYLGNSDTPASPSFLEQETACKTALPRSTSFLGAVYKTEITNFPCRKPILSNLQQKKQVLPLIQCVTYGHYHWRSAAKRRGQNQRQG